MSTESHTPKHNEAEHGSVASYVVGFMLSLTFTIIPYYLVVNKTISGTALLVTLLGCAVVQLFIQLFFFLHLGRGPKPLYNVAFFGATAGIILIAVGASIFIMNNLYRNMSPDEVTLKLAQKEGIAQVSGEETGACQGNKDNHVVTINNGVASPLVVEAKRCDTLTFINEDDMDLEIAFGAHPQDVSYGGEDYILLDDGRPETITLNESGDFNYHDHMDLGIVGRFSVNP